MAHDQDPHGWRQEGRDLLRGMAAGAIVGMPLIFTMEMWWHGMISSPLHLLVILLATLAVNTGFCFFSGFRHTYSLGEAVSESISSVGVGLIFSMLVLLLIGQIDFSSAFSETLGKILIQTAPVSLGISFANSQVRGKSRQGGGGGGDGKGGKSGGGESAQGGGDGGGGNGGGEGREQSSHQDKQPDPTQQQLRQDLKDLGASVAGAVVFSFQIAPTEEIIMIASRLPAWHHLIMMAASLFLGYLILFAAGFRSRHVYVESFFQTPPVETINAYAIALLVSFALLYLIGVPEIMRAPSIAITSTVTLGVVAMVGASAGRLIV